MCDIVKRIIRQRCMGYSLDFKSVFYEMDVELRSGEFVTMYEEDREIRGDMFSGELTRRRPFVARRLTKAAE